MLSEDQVFRIDHYLGKETVQNMLAFRFANGLFEPIWNRNFIDYVQITASEDIGIGSRAGYYDTSGALRDLVQNHMLQLLCLLCMEPPVNFSPDEVRDEKVKVLHAIHPPEPDEVPDMAVRAQYAAGMSGGEQATGYLEEDDVPDDSSTETYAALRLEVDNWRWAGVPIYLRTGKRLARKVTEIAVTLKPVPHLAFKQEGSVGVQPNQIILTMQPNEGVVDLARGEDPRQPHAHPAGEHGVPLRHGVHVPVARGLRAPDHGRHARRRHALHPRRRGGGPVDASSTRSSSTGTPTPGTIPQYPAGSGGPDEADAAAAAGPPLEGDLSLQRPRLVGPGHLAGGGRGRPARAAQGAARGERGLRARARAEPGGGGRPRVARRDPEPPRQRGPLPRVAHDPLRRRAGPHHASTRGPP